MFGRTKRRADIEGGAREIPIQDVLDYDDDSWVLDHHRKNLIEKISKRERSWYETLGQFGGKESGRTRTSSNNEPQGDVEESYRINLAELQRLRLRQLQRRLVQHVVDLRYDAQEPTGWADDLRDYGESRDCEPSLPPLVYIYILLFHWLDLAWRLIIPRNSARATGL